ncbi:MAG: membrane protein insertion efficiency factor YidD [Clostridia bacterium]|jgi:putative membrane protein insertion efficiency factor|nr:membrane protein insertion efficiency factor YidD [Clostridia bacterium]
MKKLCIALIRFYQKHLSGLKRRPTCRFTPTCSSYAIEAFEKRGFIDGMILSTWRILRCNPFCEGGEDPVPETGFRRVYRPVPKKGESIAAQDSLNTDNASQSREEMLRDARSENEKND